MSFPIPKIGLLEMPKIAMLSTLVPRFPKTPRNHQISPLFVDNVEFLPGTYIRRPVHFSPEHRCTQCVEIKFFTSID
jgi:hypothetical protein